MAVTPSPGRCSSNNSKDNNLRSSRMALSLVQNHFGGRSDAAYFYAILEVVSMRKLKKYKPTRFMAKTSHYDKDAADYAVMFIESLCHTKGTWAGKPFELIDWQEQIIRDLFGVLKPNGYRQFNTAYIEIPKKQGKSELAAAVALLLLCGDGEERAEVYGCAADRNQAKIVFDVAVDMVRFCPALSKRVKILESQKKITYLPTNSSYQVLSADVANKHGFNTHGVIFDELHTQPNRKLFDVMLQGSGDARMQPLYFLITTAGNDTNSICYEVHQKAIDIAEGRKVDPTFYSVIYGAAEDEDWTDPKVWKKANPSLGITVGVDKVKAACESAQQNPGEENAFRQLRLNQWVKQSVRWMPMDKWDACAFPVSEDDLEGRICYGGLDLSSTTDITAFVLVFPPLDEEDKYYILPYFWIPEETLDLRVRRDHVPYDLWERQGTLMTTEGNVVHYGYIEKFIERLGEKFNIREIAFDRWGAVQMMQNLEGMGFTVVPFGQGFKDMSPPTKELMKLVLEEKIAHGGHPVLRWMMDNIFIRTDPAGNIKADKEKSTEKIDGAIATIMGLDRAIRCGNDTGASVYDSRGLLFI
nr:MAG TPA: Terminase large subunit [Caudoviricetes sp.]